ncbi:hypothetical protein QBZ16_000425 [Prototheca wickerhamii]|uniref:Aminomethyltransferase n=1 Tax=Prototheca wickerhamii TaxID=3111 RepID=A0AAD9IL99_PROWI|nr:hypothetical protein QBZ16_000425 [Prototheca wickerhamii]
MQRALTRGAKLAAGFRAQCQASTPVAFARLFASDADLKKTPLYDFHVENGGKMVPFAGWSMPIQYKDSIIDSTLHCRSAASLFDVSHMCGVTLRGPNAGLVVGDIQGLAPGTGTLSVLTNERGGIIDDTVITKVADDEIYMVLNAGCRDKDLAHLRARLEGAEGVTLEVLDDRALLALQGPEAAAVLQALVAPDLARVGFGQFLKTDILGADCYVTRTGYTGEDGFEISVPNAAALDLAKKLVADERVRLCGLGARDALRLEAGLCLYGNDLDEDVTPIEAGLTWTIGKRRREAWDFLGGDVLRQQLADGPGRRRVGFVSAGPPARGHSELATPEGEVVGEVTSGAFSPCLKKNVAMGYVKKGFGKAGTELKVSIRGKTYDATVTKMPFVPTKYYKLP